MIGDLSEGVAGADGSDEEMSEAEEEGEDSEEVRVGIFHKTLFIYSFAHKQDMASNLQTYSRREITVKKKAKKLQCVNIKNNAYKAKQTEC